MLELICHHHYTWDGLPADISPYRNHGSGINTGGGADGAEPGSGVVTFPQPNSRVLIQPGLAWQPLTALQIDVLAYVDPQAKPLPMLVAGHGSFRFGLLEGALAAQFENGSGSNNYVRSDENYAPDGKFHQVPKNRWVRLGFYHDGFAKMRLFMDGELVGEAVIEGSIPPVQSVGIAIGNDIENQDRHFPGQIDEVKIWRLDPKAMKREFLGRPYTKKAARCWERNFVKVFDWMKKHPEQTRGLAQQVREWEYEINRALLLLPDSDQARVREVLATILDLWLAGKLTGPAMAQAWCDWLSLLRSLGIDPGGGPLGEALAEKIGELGIDVRDIRHCDLHVARFLKLLRGAVKKCGGLKGV